MRMIDSLVRLRWPGAWVTTLRVSFFALLPLERAREGRV